MISNYTRKWNQWYMVRDRVKLSNSIQHKALKAQDSVRTDVWRTDRGGPWHGDSVVARPREE